MLRLTRRSVVLFIPRSLEHFRVVSDESAESCVEVLQTGHHLSKPRSLVRVQRPTTSHDGKPTIMRTHLLQISIECYTQSVFYAVVRSMAICFMWRGDVIMKVLGSWLSRHDWWASCSQTHTHLPLSSSSRRTCWWKGCGQINHLGNLEPRVNSPWPSFCG